MTDHDHLRSLASNPGLIDQEAELSELLDHSRSCRECSDLLNRSVAFFDAVSEPLMHIGPHLSFWRMALLRWKRFQPGVDVCRRLEEWHLTCCPTCRSRYAKPARQGFPLVWRWVSAVLILAIGGSLLVYRFSAGTGESGFRAPERLVLSQPTSGATVTIWQEFKWTDVNATKYVVEIRSRASGTRVLEKELAQSFFVLGQQEAALLHDKEEYSWTVTAFIGTRTVVSQPRLFRFEAAPAANDEIRRLRLLALHSEPSELPKVIEDLKQQLARYPSGGPAAQIRSSIGDALLRSRIPEKAVQEYKVALQTWDSLGNPDLYDQQRTFANFALASQRMGDFSGALSAYRTSHAALRRLSDLRFVRLRSNCAINEGTLERRLGDYRAAKAHFEEALEIDRKLFTDGIDKNESRIAEDLNNLGNLIVEDLEDPQTGLGYLLQAREIHQRSEKLNGRPDDNAGDIEDSIAVAYELLGRDAEAIEQFRKALAKGAQGTADSTATDQTLNSLAELSLRNKDLPGTLRYLKQAEKLNPKPNPDEWWRTEELLGRLYLAKGNAQAGQQHILLSIQTVQQFISALPVDERATYQAEHLWPFFVMTRLLASKGDTSRAYMCMESARGQSAMGENWCDPHATDSLPPIRIAARSVALAYFAGDDNDPVLCFFLRGDRIAVDELKTSKEIEAEIKDYLRTVDSAAGEELRRRLAADLLPPELPGMLSKGVIQRILIAPEAGLNKISFESLIPSDGGQCSHSSLIDYAAVEIVPSVLAWRASVAKHDQPKDALIVTAANISSCPESLRLPWADKEATEVAKLASSGTRHLIGTEATATILGSDVSQYRILHLAVHGQSAHNMDGSELLLNCSSNDVLAGDRIKTSRLSGQLVVLSSCESAVGKASNGEGIDSLAEVFLHAGASCVIAARSRVSDKNAYDLMNMFYQELALQKPIDIALQQTQRTLKQKLPFQEWGSFSAFGRCDYMIPITPTLVKRFELRLEGRQ